MATDKWVEFADVELFNLSRTAQLAEVMGIDTVWTDPATVAWIETARGTGQDYGDVGDAPWYDPGFPASGEFAGVMPLSMPGLDDSTAEASTIEYITDGGSSGKTRNKTLTLVASVAIVASTPRGADYGKRWLDRMLRGTSGLGRTFCSGSIMRYYRVDGATGSPAPDIMHRRDVTLTRGVVVTRKRDTYCSSTWTATFTLTANDPFEYSEEMPRVLNLGAATPTAPVGAPALLSYGSLGMVEQDCPSYDYSPIYDPLYPAFVAPPAAPQFYPDGWDLVEGVNFTRYWARIASIEPSSLNVVPVLSLKTGTAARMVRVSVWPGGSALDDYCGALWTAIVMYLPAGGVELVVDSEQHATYVWDGVSPLVRRADSLAYGPGAKPLSWGSFNDPSGLLVTMDVMVGAAYSGGGTIRAEFSLVAKSD